MAASSPDGESFVWKTTPKEPFPTILHCVYCRSLVSPVTPSCTFSRMTSVFCLSTTQGVRWIGKYWYSLPPIRRVLKAAVGRFCAMVKGGSDSVAKWHNPGRLSSVSRKRREAVDARFGTPCGRQINRQLGRSASRSQLIDEVVGQSLALMEEATLS